MAYTTTQHNNGSCSCNKHTHICKKHRHSLFQLGIVQNKQGKGDVFLLSQIFGLEMIKVIMTRHIFSVVHNALSARCWNFNYLSQPTFSLLFYSTYHALLSFLALLLPNALDYLHYSSYCWKIIINPLVFTIISCLKRFMNELLCAQEL